MSTLLSMETTMRFTHQQKSQPSPRVQNTSGGVITPAVSTKPSVSMAPKTDNAGLGQNKAGADKQNMAKSQNGEKSSGNSPIVKKPFDVNQCRTCQNRRYTDGSNDPGVSFKSPVNIDPSQSFAAVSAHESEHVSRNQAKAQENGREVVSQSVILHTAVCVECGVVYTAGGETTTVTKQKQDNTPQIDVTA